MQALRVYRAKRGLTQRDLATLAGITHSTIDRAERGFPVNIKTMHKIAQALGVEPDAISEFYHQIYGNSPAATPEDSASPTPS